MEAHRVSPAGRRDVFKPTAIRVLEDSGRVEDWCHCSAGPAYLLLPVSVGNASLSEP